MNKLPLYTALLCCLAANLQGATYTAPTDSPVQIISQEEGYAWVSVKFGTDNATLVAQLEQAGFPPAVSRLVRGCGLQNTTVHGEMKEESPIQLAIHQSPGLTRIDYYWRGICWECYIGSDTGAPLLRVYSGGPEMPICGLERKGDNLVISYHTLDDPLQQKSGWVLPLFREGLEPRLRNYYLPYIHWKKSVPLFPCSSADVACDTEQDTAFVAAAMESDIPAMEKAIAAGADPNARCCGQTALQLVCDSLERKGADAAAVVQFLLQHGADVHAGADLGVTPLQLALWQQFEEDTVGVATLLLEAGADSNANGRGIPLLFIAISKDNAPLVALLLQHGANPNATRNGGVTPLMDAAEEGTPDIIRLLLDAGADPQAVDDNGRSALDHANNNDTARLIQEYRPTTSTPQ